MKTVSAARFGPNFYVKWDRQDMQRFQHILRRIINETPRIANEAVDYATARFLISGRANMHKGRARRTIQTTSNGGQYYKVHRQDRTQPIKVWLPPAGRTDSRGRDRATVVRKFGKIRTAGAGKGSWNGAMRDHARATGRARANTTKDIIRGKVTRTEHNRWAVRNIITSELSYLRKVWPTLHVVAMRRAMTALDHILDRQAGVQIKRIWEGNNLRIAGI